jgi:hypothetical protein
VNDGNAFVALEVVQVKREAGLVDGWQTINVPDNPRGAAVEKLLTAISVSDISMTDT